ncbi:helix-turn-helix domain-containing protein [Pantoea sp. B65]
MPREQIIVNSLLEWINCNLNKPLKIEDVAGKAGYSKWHLQRMFYRVMHQTLGNYIRDRKMELAAYDLIDTQDSVIAISLKYGYDSQQSFTRSFARKYQVPPATFRRINCNEIKPRLQRFY